MFKEFRDFIQRGNAMDMAIAFVLGAAFTAIVSSLVNDLIMPFISLLTNGVDFSQLFIPLDGGQYANLAQAQEAGAAVFAYGNFINAIIQFLIIAFVVFMLVRTLNRMRKEKEAVVTTKTCKYCLSEVPLEATRCPHCTSELTVESIE
ncbi:MAG: large conductance mechanosensitive channel protein MscL [Tissierellia bacterium]|nr:large conductance mechanosensitive channel protein MscL [Tissierellia bacterium]